MFCAKNKNFSGKLQQHRGRKNGKNAFFANQNTKTQKTKPIRIIRTEGNSASSSRLLSRSENLCPPLNLSVPNFDSAARLLLPVRYSDRHFLSIQTKPFLTLGVKTEKDFRESYRIIGRVPLRNRNEPPLRTERAARKFYFPFRFSPNRPPLTATNSAISRIGTVPFRSALLATLSINRTVPLFSDT